VDTDAIKKFWLSLPAEDRCEILRFDDKAVVQRLHDHMSALCHAEIWCSANGMGSSSSSSDPGRLTNFQFERLIEEVGCTGCMSSPVSFVARPELAQNDQLFDHLAWQLGSGFLKGRPVLQRRDFSIVLDTRPNTWLELELQALQLVELAIFHAHKDSLAAAAAASKDVPAGSKQGSSSSKGAQAVSADASESAASKKKKKKKKSRKTATATEAVATAEAAEEVEEDDEVVEEAQTLGAQADEDCNAKVQQFRDSPCVEEGEEEEEDEEEDSTAAKQPENSAQTNLAETAFDSAKRTLGWHLRFLRDGSREWLFQPSSKDPTASLTEAAADGLRVVVRNTFVDVVDGSDLGGPAEPNAKRRGRSAAF